MFSTISGMNAQAEAFAFYLKLCCEHFTDGDRLITTTPYLNCRERGFVISLREKDRNKHFAWFEHRNSDSLCVIAWDAKEAYAKNSDYFNTDDIPRAAYPDKWAVTKSFSCGAFGEASCWLSEEVRKFYEQQAA